MILSKTISSKETIVRESAVAVGVQINGGQPDLRAKVEKLFFEQMNSLDSDALEILRRASGGSIVIRLVEAFSGPNLPAGAFEISCDGARSAGAIANEAVDRVLEFLGENQPQEYGQTREFRDAALMRQRYGIGRADEVEVDPDLAGYKPNTTDEVDPTLDPSIAAYNAARQK